MSTFGDLIERLYRTYLYPPDARPAQAHLSTAISPTDLSVVFKYFVIPEDEELVTTGVAIEIDQELIQVVSYDPLTKTATSVLRGIMGTTPAAHSVDAPILLSAPYPRLSVYESLADNVLTLYPRLFSVNAKNISPVGPGVYDIEDPLAVSVVSVWGDSFQSTQDIDGQIVDFHQAVGGRALVTNVAVGSVWVRYKRRFGEPVSEATTFAEVGLEERWANIVMAGTAGDLFAGRDLPASHTEWVKSALEAQNIPVGTRTQLARQLLVYKDHLLAQAQKEMRAEYKAKVHTNSATQVVTRPSFG